MDQGSKAAEEHTQLRQPEVQALWALSTAVSICSAGIGRTGCFIATRIGCQQLKDKGDVDILGIVCRLRIDRLVLGKESLEDAAGCRRGEGGAGMNIPRRCGGDLWWKMEGFLKDGDVGTAKDCPVLGLGLVLLSGLFSSGNLKT